MKYLVDASVLSEATRAAPDAAVLDWPRAGAVRAARRPLARRAPVEAGGARSDVLGVTFATVAGPKLRLTWADGSIEL